MQLRAPSGGLLGTTSPPLPHTQVSHRLARCSLTLDVFLVLEQLITRDYSAVVSYTDQVACLEFLSRGVIQTEILGVSLPFLIYVMNLSFIKMLMGYH